MATDLADFREKAGFYWFWAWEYTKRNRGFSALFGEYKALVAIQGAERGRESCAMPDDGLDAIGADLGIFPDEDNGESSIEARKRFERLGAIKSSLYAKYGYDVALDNGFMGTSEEIIQLLSQGEELPRPVSGRWRFNEMFAVQECEHVSGVKRLDIGGHTMEGFDALLAVDFSKDIKTLAFELEAAKLEYEDRQKWADEEWSKTYDAKHDFAEIKRGNSRLAFRVEDATRAVGIWVWDDLVARYGHEWPHGALEAAFKRAEERCAHVKKVSDSNNWRWLLMSTEKCIEQTDVLSFGKSKSSK